MAITLVRMHSNNVNCASGQIPDPAIRSGDLDFL